MKYERMQERLLVDPKTAARMLSVSERKLFSMTHEDVPNLPYLRVGRLIRYSPDDLQRWIAMRTEGGDDGAR